MTLSIQLSPDEEALLKAASRRCARPPASAPASGFGMLKSKCAAVPADFDPATLVKLLSIRRI